MKQLLKELLSKAGYHATRENRRLTYDVRALTRIQHLIPTYLPWGDIAIRPSALEMLFNEILIHDRRKILECGCGISTIMLSHFLEPLGGKIVSIDDNKEWIDITKRYTSPSNVEIYHCPLKLQSIKGKTYNWYHVETIKNALQNRRFDLLIVDGPVGIKHMASRYPAVPVLAEYLEDDFTVALDDAFRREEREAANAWSKEMNWNLKIHEVKSDLAILRANNARIYHTIG